MSDIKEFEKKEITRKVDISEVLVDKDSNKNKSVSDYQISNELDKYENILIKKRKLLEE